MLAGFVVAGLCSPAAVADQVANDTFFCDGKASGITGEGSSVQVAVHVGILQPAFNRACVREAGLVTYLGTSEFRAVQSLIERERAFGAADVALSPVDKALIETSRFWLSQVHQIPLFVDGWAVAYNIPCDGPQLKLTGLNLSLMYSGLLTSWDDPRLTIDNPWLSGCASPVLLTRRAETAGATRVFQDYLSKENPQWLPYARGIAPSPWPMNRFDCNGYGETGMVNCINNLVGSIGYVEMAVARASEVDVALVQNATRSFVGPTGAGCSTAAASAIPPPGTSPAQVGGRNVPWVPATLGDWSAVSITNAPDPVPGPGRSYPMCSFSYVYVLQAWSNGYNGTVPGRQTRTTVDYLTVALADGTQAKLRAAGYADLPARIRQVAREGVGSISYFYFTTAGI